MISVLIPCHNAGRWLKQAIESVQVQSYREIEILVHDDGSTDNSADILEELAKSDSRIRVSGSRSNQGIVATLNMLLDHAKGRYVARMDADDISMPERLERQLLYLDQTECDLCGSWFREFGQAPPRTSRWPTEDEALRAAMLFQNTICHPTVLARREVFDHFRYREAYRLAEDYDLWVRASTRFRLCNVPETLLKYRRHSQQATQAKRASMEEVTRRIRIEALHFAGITASPEEQRLHNLVRAPESIHSLSDLEDIESWLMQLLQVFDNPAARRVVASQWVRACVRAAPQGRQMWSRYRDSQLRRMAETGPSTDIDLYILSRMRTSYASPTFAFLRRLGLSA